RCPRGPPGGARRSGSGTASGSSRSSSGASGCRPSTRGPFATARPRPAREGGGRRRCWVCGSGGGRPVQERGRARSRAPYHGRRRFGPARAARGREGRGRATLRPPFALARPRGSAAMSSPRIQQALESAIAALSAPAGDALAKAAAEGFPEREDVVAWSERVLRLVLHRRERPVLETELPDLAHWLRRILAPLHLPAGVDADGVVARFVGRLAAVRALLAEDV